MKKEGEGGKGYTMVGSTPAAKEKDQFGLISLDADAYLYN